MLFKQNFSYLKQENFKKNSISHSFWYFLHIDLPLLIYICAITTVGLIILYSASGENIKTVAHQIIHLLIALAVMILFAQIPPTAYKRWAIWAYLVSMILLILVILIGYNGKGASRWLNLMIIRFQPSEIIKLTLPLALAWYCHNINLPLAGKHILITATIMLLPAILTAKQPDLGTAILQIIAGSSVLLLAGISWYLIGTLIGVVILASPIIWYLLHDYQKNRILTFLEPGRDPLGSGYHIIQSKIAIGSGGLFGKGWLTGTQSHLNFLPEHTTDFIFAVFGEEWGFIGSSLLVILLLLTTIRGLQITLTAQDNFSRLLAGSITISFFIAFFINIGMVTGILPVVGLPLPLISYGGSAIVTIMAEFGILMSIKTHRKLISS